MLQPAMVGALTILVAVAAAVILAAMTIKASLSAASRVSGDRDQRVKASVFNSLLDQQARERIAALPSTRAKHVALAQEYSRLLPDQTQADADAAVGYFILRYGQEIGISGPDLRQGRGGSGYTDADGAFVPLMVGDFGYGADAGHGSADGGSFGGDSGGGGDGGGGGGGD